MHHTHELKHECSTTVRIVAEVAIKPETHLSDAILVKDAAQTWLQSLSRVPSKPETFSIDHKEHLFLAQHVVSITLEIENQQHPTKSSTQHFYLPWEISWIVNAFVLTSTGAEDGESYDDEDDDCPSFRQYNLPFLEFHGLWESLHYDAITIKQRLLSYASSALLFSKCNVNQQFVNFGRVILFHGPPGTGKTSLCKALAHKLSIRLHDTFPSAELIEVNAHSLFSRWFSESGKLIAKLFQNIKERLEDESNFVFVLVDEVESLAASRTGGTSPSGGDPSDAMRAVNALLTKLDQLRSYKNCLILTTSNLTESIDAAFLDRADIKMYIDLPNEAARYQIIKGSVDELIKVGIVAQHNNTMIMNDSMKSNNNFVGGGGNVSSTSFSRLCAVSEKNKMMMMMHDANDNDNGNDDDIEIVDEDKHEETTPTGTAIDYDDVLQSIARATEGMSGRALRKIPFLAHSYVQQQHYGSGSSGLVAAVPYEQFVEAFMHAVEVEKSDRVTLQQQSNE